MQFYKGQTIVHPFHGPALVTDIVRQQVRRSTRQYVVLETSKPAMKIMVPIDAHDLVGLREVSSPSRVKELLAILAAPHEEQRQPWSRRVKDLQWRLTSGKLEDLCHVIREILRAPKPAPASAEGLLLKNAQRRLGDELCLALQIGLDDAEHIIESAVSRSVSK